MPAIANKFQIYIWKKYASVFKCASRNLNFSYKSYFEVGEFLESLEVSDNHYYVFLFEPEMRIVILLSEY